jgi:hypothetical protein
MDAIALLREQIKGAHDIMEGTMADVTQPQMDWTPPGLANPLGATYGHYLFTEDWVIQTLMKGGPSLLETAWAGKHGMVAPHPTDWAQYPAWTRSARVDLATVREYGQAVYEATDAYLATLKPEDLSQIRDLSGMGMGPTPISWILSTFLLAHANNMAGEISCLKGIQGAKGYPF